MIKTLISRLFSLISLYYILIIGCTLPAFILSFTEHYSFFPALANSAVILGLVWLLSSVSVKIGRTVGLMFPLLFFAAFQIVLLYLYGRSIIAVDMFLNLVTTNSGEVMELLENLWPVLIVVCVLYVPLLTGATVAWIKKKCLKLWFIRANRPWAVIVTATGAIALLISVFTVKGYRISSDLYPLNVFYNVYLAVDRTVKTGEYHATSRDYTFHAEYNDTTATRRIALLIIGETSRSTQWQLCGYNRPTNPRLSRLDGLYMSPVALSESNTTHKSVPLLLSPVTAATYDSLYHVKSLITAFKEAGYATAFFSNQLRNHSFIDFFGEEADTVSFIREHHPAGTVASDIHLTASLADILAKENSRQLIVLHSYGSHFNYRDRYDQIDEVFTPTDYAEASKSNRDKLINAYDNSIVATDRFIARTIEMIDSAAPLATLIYTSDHGEDIFDDGTRNFLHASPWPTIHQLTVPFMVWTSADYAASHPDKIAALRLNKNKELSSSRSYFHTALDLGGVSAPAFDPAASWASPAYTFGRHQYVTDHNEAVYLDDIDGISYRK